MMQESSCSNGRMCAFRFGEFMLYACLVVSYRSQRLIMLDRVCWKEADAIERFANFSGDPPALKPQSKFKSHRMP